MTKEQLMQRLRGKRVDGYPDKATMQFAADEIERLRAALFVADTFIAQTKPEGHRRIRDRLSVALGDAAEPLPVASFPYPTDRDGWICSVCHGWNVPKDRVCMHSHLPPQLKSDERLDALKDRLNDNFCNPKSNAGPCAGCGTTTGRHLLGCPSRTGGNHAD